MIKKKIYYKVTFKLASAMNIGSGESIYTDKDMIRDSLGKPYIPSSALAGIYLRLLGMKESSADKRKYFGYVDINRNIGGYSEGQGDGQGTLKLYDGYLEKADYFLDKRDGVGLDQYKTALQGAKFDYEIIGKGASFVTYIEQDMSGEDRDIGLEIVSNWSKKGLSLGHKTMTGLGKTKIVSVEKAEFEFPGSIEQWLGFDMYDGKDWTPLKEEDFTGQIYNDNNHIIHLYIKQEGGVAIRRYSTDVNTAADSKCDYSQLTTEIDGKETPVIPGSSLKGALKHRMEELIPGCTEQLCGSQTKRSRIEIGEPYISGELWKEVTRTALDRFTGGAVGTALYGEKYCYNGNTELEIKIPKDSKEDEVRALIAVLFDFHFGFLAVGGLTSVGRGVFSIAEVKINGKNVQVPETLNAKEIFKEWEKSLTAGEKEN